MGSTSIQLASPSSKTVFLKRSPKVWLNLSAKTGPNELLPDYHLMLL